jgi:hypothetical protein
MRVLGRPKQDDREVSLGYRAQMKHQSSLVEILTETAWFSRALIAVREIRVPNAYIGSGAIRNAVWDSLHNYAKPSELADIDVAYFDEADLAEESEHAYEDQLRMLEPRLPWDVKNQAAVHLWFHEVFDHKVAPLKSIEDAAGTWPEFALTVAVRLNKDDTVEIVAPYGLHDLFSMIVRRNPRRVSLETYERRIAQKRYTDRWPMVNVVHEARI